MINLSKMIFDYWAIWVTDSDPTMAWADLNETEGLIYYNGYNATFWYMLNFSWYLMNDKLYAKTGCKEPFDFDLGDLDEQYLIENGYK